MLLVEFDQNRVQSPELFAGHLATSAYSADACELPYTVTDSLGMLP
jgi:hypothetical protein